MRFAGPLAAFALALAATLIPTAPTLAQVAIEQVDPDTVPLPRADPQSSIIELKPCGDRVVSIARMQWPSAAILAHIHALILAQEFGCTVETVPGDNAATTSSMASTAQPAIAPELWIARTADTWNLAIKAQNVRTAGPAYAQGAMEGWFVPDYVVTNNPGLTSAAALKDHWQVFAEGKARARFLSCPKDWACAIYNRNLLRALGLAERLDIVEPENRLEMDRMIADAVSRREPLLFYYWQPNAILAQREFAPLPLGEVNMAAIPCLASRDCAVPETSAFVIEPVIIAVAEWLIAEAPAVAFYLQRAQMPLPEMNALLAWQNAEGATAEATAAHFVQTRPEIWRPWTGKNAPSQ